MSTQGIAYNKDVIEAKKCRRIEQREKQIKMGKDTHEYKTYLSRSQRIVTRPPTPDPLWDISKRRFDGFVKQWRRELHRHAEVTRFQRL